MSFAVAFMGQIVLIGLVLNLARLWADEENRRDWLAAHSFLFILTLTMVVAASMFLHPEDQGSPLLKPLRVVGIVDTPATSANASSPAKAYKAAYGPAQQLFEVKRAEFAQQYRAAPNEIKKSAVWNAANEWTINFAKQEKLAATKWIARVSKITTDQGGDRADVELVSDYAGMKITYRAAGSLGLKSGTLLYTKVAEYNLGDLVEFDGQFLESSKKGLDEDSWTEKGSLEQPVFRINLVDVRRWAGVPAS